MTALDEYRTAQIELTQNNNICSNLTGCRRKITDAHTRVDPFRVSSCNRQRPYVFVFVRTAIAD